MKMILGIVIGAAVVWLLLGSGLRLTTTPPVAPFAGGQTTDTSSDPPPPPPPAEQTEGDLPPPPSAGSFTCPGRPVENGGCLVTSTANVPANACVDYDPRGADHPVGSYDVIDTDQTRQRVLFKQAGQIVLSGGRATIYNNNYCPPY